jgi:hypothetical protein
VVKSATAAVTAGVVGERDQSGNVVISFSVNAKNPLSPVPQILTPGVSADLTIRVDQNATAVSVGGTVSGYPGFEGYAETNGSTTQILGILPAYNDTNLLFTEKPVVNFVPLPPPPPPPPKKKEEEQGR